MYRKLRLALASLFAVALLSLAAGAVLAQETVQPQQIPVTQYVEPSAERILQPGEKLITPAYERAQQPFVIQRLAENVYWVEAWFYESTFVVGQEGVLLIDPLSYGRGKNVLAAIRTITDLPVTTVVYSHFHYDHVGDITVFLDEATANGFDLRIIANAATVNQIDTYDYRVPLPTELLQSPTDTFEFEGMTFETRTYEAGHSPDNMAVLIPGGILHFVDMVHPGNVEFDDFGLAESFLPYEMTIRDMLTMDWQILNAGHTNIGSRADVELLLSYIDDMRAYTLEGFGQIAFATATEVDGALDFDSEFVRTDLSYFQWFQGHRDAVVNYVIEQMRPRWGEYPGFNDTVRSQAEMLYWEVYLH